MGGLGAWGWEVRRCAKGKGCVSVSGSWVSTADCLSAVESLYISRLLAAPCSRDWPTHIFFLEHYTRENKVCEAAPRPSEQSNLRRLQDAYTECVRCPVHVHSKDEAVFAYTYLRFRVLPEYQFFPVFLRCR